MQAKSVFEIVGSSLAVFDCMHSGVAIFDREGKFIYANPAFEKMYGLEGQDYYGTSVNKIFLTGAQGVESVLQTQQNIACTSVTTNGLYGITYRHPIFNAMGDIAGCICECISVDLDRNKIAEMQRLIDKFEQVDLYNTFSDNQKKTGLATFDTLIGESFSMRKLKNAGKRFAQTDEPILIVGENGTGKDLIAQAVHAASKRAGKTFVAVNCAAIPCELIESELFGYEAGAFTGAKGSGLKGKFESADGGTIFLDEIGELPIAVQSKLLRVLENKEVQKLGRASPIHVDFRFIAATNRNLEEMIENRQFREDLYHRLNIFELAIPPLRERNGDIPLLCYSLIEQLAGHASAKRIQISEEVLSVFRVHYWHGNIRELKNILTYALYSMQESELVLDIGHLPERFFRSKKEISKPPERILTSSEPVEPKQPLLESALDNAAAIAEQKIILDAIHSCDGNKSEAARILKISRNKLYNKMAKYGMKLR